MKILLVGLVLFLLFLNAEIFQSVHPSQTDRRFNSRTSRIEALSVEMPDREYYYDKTGMKGTLFNPLPELKYMLPNSVIHEPDYTQIAGSQLELIEHDEQIIKQLGIYPENLYARCLS
jgi:hypothetical protein